MFRASRRIPLPNHTILIPRNKVRNMKGPVSVWNRKPEKPKIRSDQVALFERLIGFIASEMANLFSKFDQATPA
jgi:hypothetical protein